jgi:hypothetical protein
MLNVGVRKLRAGGAAASSLRIRVTIDAEIHPDGRNPMEFRGLAGESLAGKRLIKYH